MTGTYYPPASHYYVPRRSASRPIFQGDVFAGAFGAFWAHPEAVRAHRAGRPTPVTPSFPTTAALLHDVRLEGPYALLLPHPCDYAEEEKGATHPYRLVAPVVPASHTRVPVKVLRRGEAGHLLWMPRWAGMRGEQDWAANLRMATSVDAAFLTRQARVASLTVQAWVSLNDRIATYFTGARLDRARFVLERADLHPDAPA